MQRIDRLEQAGDPADMIRSNAPAEDFIASSFRAPVPLSGMIRACAPQHSAERAMAPIFRTSVTPSSIMNKGVRPRPDYMIDHLLQVHVLHQTGKGNHPLVVGPGEAVQLLYRNDLHGDIIFPRQLPDLRNGFPGRIPLQEYLIDGATGPDRFDQRLTANNELTFLHANDSCPCTNISLTFNMDATDIESVISPLSTIRYASSKGSFLTTSCSVSSGSASRCSSPLARNI
jgi:hypothetical protein